MSGRRKNKAFDELGFLLMKSNNKYVAYCTVCNKNLHNTAESRLRSHRNACKPSQSPAASESGDVSMIVFIDGSDLSSSSGIQNSETMSISLSNDVDNNNAYALNSCEAADKTDPLNSYSIHAPTTTTLTHTDTDSSEIQSPQVATTTSSSFSLSSNSCSSSSLSLGPPPPVTYFNKNIQRSKRCPTPSNSVSKFMDRLTEREEDELNEALGKLVFGCNIPLRIVDSIHFKNFIKKIRPAYADKVPGRKKLSTTLLDQAYDKCVSSIKSSISSDSVLLIDGWKNSSSNSKTIVSMLHNAEGEQAFLQAWDLSGESETAEKLTNILSESVDLAKEIYSTQVYAVVSDNASTMKRMGKNAEHFIWHSTCSSHIGNLLAKDLIDKNINAKVALILKEFKQVDFEKMVVNRGGSRIMLPCETRWCSYRDSYKCLVKNYDIMKIVAAESTTKKIKQNVALLMFDENFIDDVKSYIELLDPVCTLINRCQAVDCSAGEAVHLWLSLKLPDRFKGQHETSLKSRVDMALNKYALSAYYLHPLFDNGKLTVSQNEIACQFLFKHLNSDGIEDWDSFNRKINFFKILYEKDIKKPIVFWNMASIKHPNLANLAKKLILIPASSAQIERVFSSWSYVHSMSRNRLTFERSKKLLHLYYSLRIEDNQYNYFDADVEDENE